MSLGLLGKKLGMTRLFDQQAGIMIPVTVIDVSGNTILQVKTPEKDGYTAVQVGYGDQKEQRVIKPDLGRFKKAGSTPKRFVQEFRFENGAAVPETHTGMETFTAGQWVDVIGDSKGKGFQGVVKRYGFGGLKHDPRLHDAPPDRCHRLPLHAGPRLEKPEDARSHGHHPHHRAEPQSRRRSSEDGVILISGAVPGPKGSYVTVRAAKKKTA